MTTVINVHHNNRDRTSTFCTWFTLVVQKSCASRSPLVHTRRSTSASAQLLFTPVQTTPSTSPLPKSISHHLHTSRDWLHKKILSAFSLLLFPGRSILKLNQRMNWEMISGHTVKSSCYKMRLRNTWVSSSIQTDLSIATTTLHHSERCKKHESHLCIFAGSELISQTCFRLNILHTALTSSVQICLIRN